MCRIGLAFVIAAATWAPRAAAQESLVRLPNIGSRVRLTSLASPGARITGVLRVVYGDSIVVERADKSTVALAHSDLEQVEVRIGERAAEQMATVFGIAGALGGGAVYVNWCRQNPQECRDDAWGNDFNNDDDPDNDSHFTVPTLLILGGALLGGAIGYGLAAPRWKTLGAPMRIGVAPLGTRGVAVGASFAVGPLRR